MKRIRRICFLGAGNMAEALIKRFIDSGAIAAKNISACDINPERLKYISKKYSVRVYGDIAAAVPGADLVVLAVKPQCMRELLEELDPVLDGRQPVMSVAAGITTGYIEKFLGRVPVVRVMPNTPALIGEGMLAVCRGRHASKSHEAAVSALLSRAGEVILLPQKRFNAVTAVSGSGPAYIFYFAELMAEAAKKLGFSAREAAALVNQTVYGAGLMLKKSGETAGTLRKKVTSPGGTTEQAVKYFQKSGLPETVLNAVSSANKRAIELTKE